MGVPGDDCPVPVVLSHRLGELEVESVGADLDGLDAAVLLDGDTILVPGQLRLACKKKQCTLRFKLFLLIDHSLGFDI